jgi:putative glutamine amidotransferase
MRPLIGIAPSFDVRGRWHPARECHFVDSAYAHAVASGGGIPVYLPNQEASSDLLDRIDGLLLPGGPDLAPDRPYPDAVQFDLVPARQLEFERRLLAGALARELPVLGICYGMQLLALHHGGALHFDIATDVPGAGAHQLPEPDGRHDVRIEAGSRLRDALGAAPGPVNSRHHQAVAEPGAGLRVCARSRDGLIEAIEREAGRFCMGVQWHPESLEGAHRDDLFGALVAACLG